MMYVRGSRQDYDDWAELAEDEGWSADVMLQYMRKHQVRLMQTSNPHQVSNVFQI